MISFEDALKPLINQSGFQFGMYALSEYKEHGRGVVCINMKLPKNKRVFYMNLKRFIRYLHIPDVKEEMKRLSIDTDALSKYLWTYKPEREMIVLFLPDEQAIKPAIPEGINLDVHVVSGVYPIPVN